MFENNAFVSFDLIVKMSISSSKESALLETLCDMIVLGDLRLSSRALNMLDDVNVLSEAHEGLAPLHLAADSGHESLAVGMIQALLVHGLDVNIRSKDGRTALHFAILRSYSDVVRLLVQFGARTDIRCCPERVPLMHIEIEISEEKQQNIRNALDSDNSATSYRKFKQFSFELFDVNPKVENDQFVSTRTNEYLEKVKELFETKITKGSLISSYDGLEDKEDFLKLVSQKNLSENQSLFLSSFFTSTIKKSSSSYEVQLKKSFEEKIQTLSPVKKSNGSDISSIFRFCDRTLVLIAEESVIQDAESGLKLVEKRILPLEKEPNRIERKESFPILRFDGHLDLWDLSTGWHLEQEVSEEFDIFRGTTKKKFNWVTREGLLRSSFNYLLLDPRKCGSMCRKSLSDMDEGYEMFLSSIFYVGKGTRSRPLAHLYDALKEFKSTSKSRKGKKSKDKLSTILDIWSEGLGVVCLQLFHHSLHAEALTREASMIEAIGLSRLTNQKPGDFYGSTSAWPEEKRLIYGSFLLYRAFRIFLLEGERQLRPDDIRKK